MLSCILFSPFSPYRTIWCRNRYSYLLFLLLLFLFLNITFIYFLCCIRLAHFTRWQLPSSLLFYLYALFQRYHVQISVWIWMGFTHLPLLLSPFAVMVLSVQNFTCICLSMLCTSISMNARFHEFLCFAAISCNAFVLFICMHISALENVRHISPTCCLVFYVLIYFRKTCSGAVTFCPSIVLVTCINFTYFSWLTSCFVIRSSGIKTCFPI